MPRTFPFFCKALTRLNPTYRVTHTRRCSSREPTTLYHSILHNAPHTQAPIRKPCHFLRTWLCNANQEYPQNQQADPEPSPAPTRRRRSPSDSDAASVQDAIDTVDCEENGGSSQDRMVKKLVRLALACEYSRNPIRRLDIGQKGRSNLSIRNGKASN